MDVLDIIDRMRDAWSYMLTKMLRMKYGSNKQRIYERAIAYKMFWQELEPGMADAIQKEWESNWSKQFWSAIG